MAYYRKKECIKMEDKYHCKFPDIANVASCTECTGLMLRPPQDRDEYESYQELSGMEIPELD